MKKAISAFVLVMVLVAVGSMPAVMAQTVPYTVSDGDTVYALKGVYSSSQPEWKAFTILNPFLAEPGRAFVAQDGRFIVVIRPGETLVGVDQLGVAVEPLPISDLGLAPATLAGVEQIASGNTTAETQSAGIDWMRVLLWGLLSFALVALAAYLWLRSRNPGTAGQPIVAGGVQPDQSDLVEQRAQQIADRHFAASNPTADLQTDRPERVGPIEEGALNGWGRVQYRTGLPMPRHFTNEAAYRARFRFSDGHEEELFFLQACANDVTLSGARYVGFTFTSRRAVVAAPQPTPSPARPTPIAVPAAARPTAEQVLFTIGGIRLMVPAGSVVRAGENGEILLTVAGPCDIRINQRIKKPARPKAVQKTGTAE